MQWVLEDCFNKYTKLDLEFLEIKCLALDKGIGTLSLEVRYQLPGNPPQEILQARLHVDGLQSYFASYQHQLERFRKLESSSDQGGV